MGQAIRSAKQRQAALHAIDWLEKAIWATERFDYPAAERAVNVARIHLGEAEELTNATACD